MLTKEQMLEHIRQVGGLPKRGAQRELSIQFGISESHMSLILSGKKPVPRHVAVQLGYEPVKTVTITTTYKKREGK